MFSLALSTEVEIDASAEQVWAILSDFESFPDWNPFIRSIQGEPAEGEKLEVVLQPSGTKAMTFKPTLVAVEEARELRWLGRVLMPGLFDGEHRFQIEPLADGKVRFVQSEQFKGALVPLMKRSLERDAKRGFAEMNQALKERAEAVSTAG